MDVDDFLSGPDMPAYLRPAALEPLGIDGLGMAASDDLTAMDSEMLCSLLGMPSSTSATGQAVDEGERGGNEAFYASLLSLAAGAAAGDFGMDDGAGNDFILEAFGARDAARAGQNGAQPLAAPDGPGGHAAEFAFCAPSGARRGRGPPRLRKARSLPISSPCSSGAPSPARAESEPAEPGSPVADRSPRRRAHTRKKIPEDGGDATTAVSRYWSPDEHERFAAASRFYGLDYDSISAYVGTRSATQARTHAQKYLAKLTRDALAIDAPKAGPKTPRKSPGRKHRRKAAGVAASAQAAETQSPSPAFAADAATESLPATRFGGSGVGEEEDGRWIGPWGESDGATHGGDSGTLDSAAMHLGDVAADGGWASLVAEIAAVGAAPYGTGFGPGCAQAALLEALGGHGLGSGGADVF